MENFPTKRQHLIPLVTNLATLAVVVSATWWSGAQRPMSNLTAVAEVTSTKTLTQAATMARDSAGNQNSNTPAAWPQAQTALQPDAIKTVGFASTTLR